MLPHGYQPRNPESTALYQIVQQHLETFLEHMRERTAHGYGLPRFIERTLYSYLECGVLARGFCRVRCEGCGYEMLLAFSCKRRGVCPSCEGRRMADTAAHLVDRVLPQIPYRQWTLSFPRRIRFVLVRDRALLSDVMRIFLRKVFAWQRRRARATGVGDGRTGSVSFIQRFGGYLNANTHLHATLPDGVFDDSDDGPPRFVELAAPSDDDIETLTRQIVVAVDKRLARRNDNADLDDVPDALAHAQATSVQSVQSLSRTNRDRGNRDRDAARRTRRSRRCALIEGFSLHANVRIHANDRLGLERLLRYGARPAIAHKRLSLTPDGRVQYRFRRPSPSGATCWVGTPVEFLSRLTTLIPPRRQHSVRYHGVFAPNSKLRSLIVPRAPARDDNDHAGRSPASSSTSPPPKVIMTEGCTTAPQNDAHEVALDSTHTNGTGVDHHAPPASILVRRLDWAQLLRRVFAVDVTQCPRCPGRLRVIAFITYAPLVATILAHLGLPTQLPSTTPARGPPQTDFADGFDAWA